MMHLIAFGSSISNDGALHQLDQIADGVLPASNNGILVPPQYKGILAAFFVGANLERGQIVAPSLRDYGNQDIEPINKGTAFESPVRAPVYYPNILPLICPEEVDAYGAQDGTAAETDYAFFLLSDGVFQPAVGRMLQAHWTASKTLVAGAWTSVQPTLDNPLASGTYALVGAHTKSATALAFRIIPNGQQSARPGGIAVQTVDQLVMDGQRQGRWGTWLQFTNYTVPNIDIFATAADTSEEGIFDLIPL